MRNSFLNRLAMHLTAILAISLVLSGCTSSPPRGGDYVDGSPAEISAQRQQLIHIANAQIGAPYRYGGDQPSGFDCSGLVQFSHARTGIPVPRTTAEQWRTAPPLDRSYLLPGDILFFRLGTWKPQHVGIYEGNGQFIHAPSSGKRVSRASLDNPYWRNRWIGTRTFL